MPRAHLPGTPPLFADDGVKFWWVNMRLILWFFPACILGKFFRDQLLLFNDLSQHNDFMKVRPSTCLLYTSDAADE